MDQVDSNIRVSGFSCSQCGSIALDQQKRHCCGEEMNRIPPKSINEPELPVLLSQVLGISQTGVEICVHLMSEEEATTDELAATLDVNRTTVTRQLAQLREMGVVDCREKPLDGGGRIHVYSPVPLPEIRQRHREALLSWVTSALTCLDELDQQKLEAIAGQEREEGSL
jgi:predicted transcriptional regulator